MARRGFFTAASQDADRGRLPLIASVLVALIVAALPMRAAAAELPSAYYFNLRPTVTSDEEAFYSDAPEAGSHVANVRFGLKGFWMEGPGGAPLTVGTYPDATSITTPDAARFASTDCSTPATFVVHEITYAPDESLLSIAFDFDCASNSHGSVRFHSAWPVQALTTSFGGTNLGDVVTGQSKSQTITMTSSGTVATTIAHIGFTGTGSASWSATADGCTGVLLAPGGSCTFDATFTPTSGGDSRAAIQILWSPAAAPLAVGVFVWAHGVQATTTTAVAYPDHVAKGQQAQFRIRLDPAPSFSDFAFYVDDVYVGAVSASFGPEATASGVWPVGHHTIRAEYLGTSDYAPSTGTDEFWVVEPTSTTLSVSRTTAYSGQSVTMVGTLTGPDAATEGILRIVDTSTSTILGSVAVTASTRSVTVTTSSLGIGAHAIVAEYVGTDSYGHSAQWANIEVLSDSDVAIVKTLVSPTTLYPYKDGYRDVATISGITGELASVSVSIYNSAGTKVYTKGLGNRDGAYALSWTGRSTSGSALAAGKYRVVQTFRDATGHTRVITAYINLSSKRLYTYTKYLDKSIAQAAKKTSSMIGWEFVLPSATVYKSLSFQVYGRSSLIPGLSIGGVDFRQCGRSTTWSLSCVSSWGGVGGTTGWYSRSLFTTHNRTGRYVRGIVTADGSGLVYKARLRVVYGVLK